MLLFLLFSAGQAAHRLIQKFAVEVVTDCLHMAVLLGAEHIARAANLQIPHGDSYTAAELRELADCAKSLFRLFAEQPAALVEQKGIADARGAPDTPPELIELREAEVIRLLDDDGVDIRNVQTGLDYGRRDQYIDLTVHKVEHDALQLLLLHLPVRVGDLRLRQFRRKPRRNLGQPAYFIADIVDLTAPVQLALHSLPHDGVAVLHHIGLDRLTVPGRLGEYGELSYARKTHVQGARNRRGRQRQHIDILPQLLHLLLVRDPEALLLVDDQESQLMGFDVL